jgi:hypothetical protein
MAESAWSAAVEVVFPDFLVLFDLVDVLVVEKGRPAAEKQQFFLLQQDSETIFSKFSASVGILTHRPRREAKAILSAAGIDDGALCQFYCAEDLLRVAIKRGRLFELLHAGLKKSHAVVDISKRTKISPERICMKDDRAAIIEDMASHGVGLRLHVDQEGALASGDLLRFDPDQVAAIFRKWASRRAPATTVKVQGQRFAREQLQLVDLDLSGSGSSLFEWSRPIGRSLGKALDPRRLARAWL